MLKVSILHFSVGVPAFDYKVASSSRLIHQSCCRLSHRSSFLVFQSDARVLNCPDAQGVPPIGIAAYRTDVELIRLFASRGADLEVKTQARGETPLLIACQVTASKVVTCMCYYRGMVQVTTTLYLVHLIVC